jgi:aldose 1-epimerase
MKRYFVSAAVIVFGLFALSCQSKNMEQKMIEKQLFGKLDSGEEVYSFTLTNENGMKAKIINYGAIVVSLEVPDKNGKLGDVILGYDNLEGYVNDNSYQGSIVGRYGNRIGKGKFVLDGNEYQLDLNDGENHLHGGSKGFFQLYGRRTN